MHGAVEAEGRGVEAKCRHRGEADRTLPVLRERPVADPVAGSVARRSDQRLELVPEPLEDVPHLGRRRARLEVVEEDVVGVGDRLEARDVLALQLELPVEPRSEGGVVVGGARRNPGLDALGRGLRQPGREVRGNAPRLLPVTAGDPDQAGVVGVVGE